MDKKYYNSNKKYKGILAIDFDDTIAYSNFPDIVSPVKGSKKYINRLIDDDWYIIINTCRCDDNIDVKPLTMAKTWLHNNNIGYHKLNEHNDHLIKIYGNDTRKIAADFYIDDKNIFGLKSWKKIYKHLSGLKRHVSCLRYREEGEVINE